MQLLTLRKRLNLSQAELARRIGTSQQQVQRWEGGTTPNFDTIRNIATTLSVPIDQLLEPNPPVRFAHATSEQNIYRCIKNSLWGDHKDRLRDWVPGEYVVLKTERGIHALVKVSGPAFEDSTEIWPDALSPHRIQVRVVRVFSEEEPAPFAGIIRDTLLKLAGTKYGLWVLNHIAIEGSPAKVIVDDLLSRPDCTASIMRNIDSLILGASNNSAAKLVPSTTVEEISMVDDGPLSSSTHLQTQLNLVKLGIMAGCSVWVARDNRKMLLEKCEGRFEILENLPSVGISDIATKLIERIDIIWFKQNAPICAFEIETSTPIYSGILRMSDLLAFVPAIKTKLYLVAQREKEERVLGQLSRPTFQKIGLNEVCRFVPIEDLDKLLAQISGLEGHLQPSIINKISVELDTYNLEQR